MRVSLRFFARRLARQRLAPLGETVDGQILNINADVATRELACAVQSHKIIFLTETGGLLDGDAREAADEVPLGVSRIGHLMSPPLFRRGARLECP